MVQALVKAYFPISPSDDHKEYIKKKLISLIREADPSVDWELHQKDGSWEISIIVWCGEKLAEWMFGKSLDGLMSKTKNKILQWREGEPSLPLEDNLLRSSGSSANLASTPVDSALALSSEEAVYRLCHKVNTLIEELGPSGEKIQLTFASYDNVHGGRVFTASRDGESKNFSLISTDSKEDFDLKTGFDLKQ